MRRFLLAVVLGIAVCALSACERIEWKVTAYDLSGKEIYRGDVVTQSGEPLKTAAGKRIQFSNATLIYEEK